MLVVRDLVIVCDTNVPTSNFVNVLSNTGSVVDVSDGTAVAETDGDKERMVASAPILLCQQ